MRKITALMLLGGLCLGLLSGCAVHPAAAADLNEGIVKNELPPSADLKQSGGLADFAANLLKGADRSQGDPLVSPLSVIAALALVQNGAEGETLEQLEAALGLSQDQLNEYMLAWRAGLPDTLRMANGIWFKEDPDLQVSKDFLQTNADYLAAAAHKAPFDDSTVRQINSWVKEHTDGMIDSILDKMPEDALMVLANALSFDAEWAKTYQDHQVREGTFTTEDQGAVPTELMYETGYMPYLELPNATGFLKNYTGGRYAFLGLLPAEGVTMADFLAALDGSDLADAVAEAQRLEVRTAIPKFESDYSTELSDVLQGMGITRAFSNSAQFAPMAQHPQGLKIGSVLHKTVIRLDQKGTKAGAVTAVIMAPTSAAPGSKPEPKVVYLDRPFVYAIWDLEANLPVFLGVCTEP